MKLHYRYLYGIWGRKYVDSNIINFKSYFTWLDSDYIRRDTKPYSFLIKYGSFKKYD